MSDGITMGDEELDCKGIEVPGGELDPLCDLIAWTENVRALDRAVVAFPGLEAVVDDNGYWGPSALLNSPGYCWLLCGSPRNARQVFLYLEDHAEELTLVPDLEENKAVVHIHARRSTNAPPEE